MFEIHIYMYLNIIKYYQIYLISISILFRFFVFPRIQNLQRLIAACDSVGACAFLVPGDGNCLLWSIIRLCLEEDEVWPDPTSPEGISSMMRLRGELKEKWIDVAGDLQWQIVFQSTCPDGYVEKHLPKEPASSQPTSETTFKCKEEVIIATPKRKKPHAPVFMDLSTPPSAAQKEKKRRLPPRIGNSQPAQVAQSHKPDDSLLKVPQKKMQRPQFLEPAAADLEERFSQMMMEIPGEKKGAPLRSRRKLNRKLQNSSNLQISSRTETLQKWMKL